MTGKPESHITTRATGSFTRAEHKCVRGEIQSFLQQSTDATGEEESVGNETD